MHVDLLDRLLELPATAFSAIAAGETLCFIIDRQTHSDALSQLYGVGEPIEIEPLYFGTEFASMDDGPLWLQARWGGELARCAARLCENQLGGIALRTAHPAKALAHARWLLRANDGSGGQSLLSYHKPSLWAALSLTDGATRDSLLGPWLSVYSPAPSHFFDTARSWLSWPGNPNAHCLSQHPAFTLPARTAQDQQRLDWLYWLDEYFAEYGSPERARLPGIIVNLDLLVQGEIFQSDHLLKLATLTAEAPFAAQPQAMAILQTTDYDFIKVDRLLEMAGTTA
ncbi:DUF4123 domain-containing protein [Pseudomonas baltica]|uniref:DUF4123 domain-containing protein n=1 Tax=Pseudomonas baltica TaxID=2762576 RepID=UPI00289C2B35|nr:DUF4123 domain-containing protein [Pseudomonas baltica]